MPVRGFCEGKTLFQTTDGAGARVRSAAVAAFVASLLLSLISVLGSDDLNRDGMLYVDAARALTTEGWAAARARFDWLFMPALMGGISLLPGLEPEVAGYLLGALLVATACACAVLVSERVFQGTAWAACLVVLAMPAFNDYRDHIIREFGLWCFTLVAILQALRWSERPDWLSALGAQLALFVAAAFRVEAVAFLPLVLVWQLYAVRHRMGVATAAKVLALPAAALLALGLALAMGGLDIAGRVQSYWSAIDLAGKSHRFDAHVEDFRAGVLPSLSHADATSILLMGLVSLIPVKFLQGLGIFVVPIAFSLRAVGGSARVQLLNGLFVLYCLILAAFVSERLFLTGRYVSYLNLLAVPFVAYGGVLMIRRWPRLQWVLVVVAVIAMLANVVSLSERKPQFRNAGEWLSQHAPEPDRVYVEGRRVRYHAGYPIVAELAPEAAMKAPYRGRFHLFVVEWDADDHPESVSAWLAKHRMSLVTRFDGPGADVLVLEPLAP